MEDGWQARLPIKKTMENKGASMKAVRYHGIKDLRIDQIEIPTPTDDEVLIKVLYAGICGSDFHIYRKGMFVVHVPETMGHEVVGIIEGVGAGVEGFGLGDLVAVDPRVSCGKCPSCLKGAEHTCDALGFIGEVSQGGFAEYLTVKQEKLLKAKPGTDRRQLALIEPFAVALHVCARGGLTAEDSLAVVGAGPIGLLTILIAKRVFHVKNITAIDLSEMRLKLAELAGADHTSRSLDVPMAYNKVVEAAGSPVTLMGALDLVGAGGTLLIAGLFENLVPLDPNLVVTKEITVKGSSVYTRSELEMAVKLIEDRAVDVDFLISKEVGLEQAMEVFKLLDTDKSMAKILFQPL
jgi:threonine dehydrogenase-like Zn-dependent dehydrogenase